MAGLHLDDGWTFYGVDDSEKGETMISSEHIQFPTIAEQLIQMQENDFRLRTFLMKQGLLNEGYHKEMETLHNANADRLSIIIDKIGYPTKQLVGLKANRAAWIIVQHAISKPAFMKRCLSLLSNTEIGLIDPKDIAYLSDRIAVFEGRLQMYGTAFDWDENFELSPKPYDDLAKVNKRRAILGFPSLDEQTQIIRSDSSKEGHNPPSDLAERNKRYEIWRKEVGWI